MRSFCGIAIPANRAMRIKAITTRKVLPEDRGLLEFLDSYVPRLRERSVLAITSKVAAILEGAVVPMEGADKRKLIAREADHWLPPSGKYDVALTVKSDTLIVAAGIDESNSGGFYVLWPKDPQRTANAVRRHFMKRFHLREMGVIVTDSASRPLRWGTFGIAIAHSGFRALNDYIGSRDIFGRRMEMTKANVMEALATSAVLTMGEGAERKPLAVIEDLPFVKFQKSDPSRKELAALRIGMDADLFAPLLKSVRWRKGKSGRGN